MTSEKYATAKQIDYIRKLCEITGETPPRNIWDTDFPMAEASKLIDDLKHLRDVQAADKAYALDKEREAQRQVVLEAIPQTKPNWQQRLHAMLSEVAEEVLHCQQKAQDAVVSCDRILERIAPTIAYLTSNKQAHQPQPTYEPTDPYQWDDTRTEPESEDPRAYGHMEPLCSLLEKATLLLATKDDEDPESYHDTHLQPSNDQDPPCPF